MRGLHLCSEEKRQSERFAVRHTNGKTYQRALPVRGAL